MISEWSHNNDLFIRNLNHRLRFCGKLDKLMVYKRIINSLNYFISARVSKKRILSFATLIKKDKEYILECELQGCGSLLIDSNSNSDCINIRYASLKMNECVYYNELDYCPIIDALKRKELFDRFSNMIKSIIRNKTKSNTKVKELKGSRGKKVTNELNKYHKHMQQFKK